MELVRALKDLIYLGLESFGRYYSVYRAFVADVDDPENLSRLRLVIPDVAGTNVYDYWAFPRNVYSGQGYGIQTLPVKGDIVWVEFEKGHANKPVWSMGYRSVREMPTGDDDLKDKECHWFITPKGHVIKINDTKNYIHIKTQQGDYVELNSSSISLVTNKKISLGKLNASNQPAVLGNDNADVLSDLQDVLQTILIKIRSDIVISQSIPSPFLHKDNLQSGINELIQKAVNIKNKIPKTKSGKVTLD